MSDDVAAKELTGSAGGRMTAASRTVADRLRRSRERRFVGRHTELELFRSALAGDEPPFTVLFIHGPGGVGKTALLKRLAGIATDVGWAVSEVDLRTVGASPPALRRALGDAGGNGRRVLLLDTYEAASGLDGWLRETFIPSLPAGTLLVIAGRNPPTRGWRSDPGWGELLRTVALRNLPPDDARAFLREAGVPAELAERVAALTHGHPLALSLLVDIVGQRPDAADLELADAPDVFHLLQRTFVEDVPSDRHRAALQACAHARFTTEDLLRSALETDDAGELFAWLASLSFIERGRSGLFPHDLVRDVLEADLRWRDPDAFATLRRRVRAHTIARLRGGDADGHDAAADLVFLHRSNPFTAAQWDWATFGDAYGDALRPDDREPLLAMTRRHEGEESARIVAHWIDRQPEAFVVVRERDERPRGFMVRLALDRATDEDLATDPGALAMWRWAQEAAPPRPGERVHAARTLIDRDVYQAPSPTLNVVTVVDTREWVAGARLSWELIGAWADERAAAPLMSYIDFHRVPAADYEVGGRRYAVFAHDWRRCDADAWLELIGARELAAGFDPTAAAAERAPEIALSHADFVAAVQAALASLHRDEALAVSPLLRSRVARDAAAPAEPGPDTLRELIERAVATLRVDPRDARYERAVVRTYVRPAGTQELAAEALGVPFSTYRRHLRRGVERVADWLWRCELHGLDG